mgnify:CR=1 FL=1
MRQFFPANFKMKNCTPFIILSFSFIFFAMTESIAAKEPSSHRTLQHVVSFKFKEGTSSAQIENVEKAFVALKGKILEIVSLEWGTNNSPEDLNKGFTHCFIVTFKDEKGRSVYLPHPEHKAFVKILKPILDDVLVIDFWTD